MENIMIFNNKMLLGVACLFLNSTLTAQETFSSSNSQSFLNPIIISGARQEQSLSDAVTSVSVITKTEIERSGAKSVGDLLKGQVGVEIGQSGGLGSLTSFFLRGTDSRNTLVFIDGVRVRDAITQSSLAENIPLALINKIEIVRGNVSALYGDGAIGGVINIFTELNSGDIKNKDKLIKKISTEYGSFNTQDISGTVTAFTNEKLNFSLGFQHIKSDGFSATNPTITGSFDATDSDNDSYKNTAVNLSINKAFADYKIGGQFYLTDSRLSFDNSFSGSNPKQESDQTIFNIFAERYWNDFFQTRFDLDKSDIKLSYNYGSIIKTQQDQFRISNKLFLSPKQSIVFGYENRNDERNPVSSGLSSRTTDSIYLGYLANFDKVSLQINFRNDDAEKTGSEFTWFIGGAYKFNKNYSMFINKSTAFGIPTAYALSTNDNLLPEDHESTELGLTLTYPNYNFRAVLFDTDTNNPITYDPSDSYIAKNFSSFKNNGLELSSSVDFNNHLFKLSWTFQDPKTPYGYDISKTVQSARRAKSFGSVDWNYSWKKYEFGAKALYSSSRYDSDYSFIKLDDYFVLSFRGKAKIDEKLSVFVRTENITNNKYQLANGYNTSPSSIYIGLSYITN
jgi:vitamin B12 transporter